MNCKPTLKSLSIILLLMTFGINCLVSAQSAKNENEEIETYEELLEYRTNHTIELDQNTEKLSEIFTGLELETPDDVYSGDLTLTTTNLDDLPEAILDEPAEEEIMAYGSFEYVEYQDMFDFEDSGGSSGLFGGGDKCVPSRGSWY